MRPEFGYQVIAINAECLGRVAHGAQFIEGARAPYLHARSIQFSLKREVDCPSHRPAADAVSVAALYVMAF